MFRLRIKEIAEAKGYNISTLSRASDVPFTTLRKAWRDPYYEIRLASLYKIAKTLGVATGDLIADEPDEEVPD